MWSEKHFDAHWSLRTAQEHQMFVWNSPCSFSSCEAVNRMPKIDQIVKCFLVSQHVSAGFSVGDQTCMWVCFQRSLTWQLSRLGKCTFMYLCIPRAPFLHGVMHTPSQKRYLPLNCVNRNSQVTALSSHDLSLPCFFGKNPCGALTIYFGYDGWLCLCRLKLL